jgi:uncharacterized membrane protein HdeD (DUF308 family)
MGQSVKFSELEQRIEQQFGLSRGILLAVGVSCLLLGALSVVLPFILLGSLLRLIGLLLLASGTFKAAQLLLGLHSKSVRERGWPAILLQVGIDVAMGLLLLYHWQASVRLVTVVFGVLFLLEGLVLADVAFRSPIMSSRRLLIVSCLGTLGIGVIILIGLVPEPLRWAGVFVGLKLLVFGAALTWIALRALRSDSLLLYESEVPDPETGELYAVYFGTAFHLGVYIGNGEIVHYLNDNHVYRVTSRQFLKDRVPQHWTYPDLAPAPVTTVVNTAISEVGRTYPYSLLRFNYENFAIFCKSGGMTRFSKYAQIASGVNTVQAHPIIGLVAELNTRVVEWLAFHFGGPAGKQLSLAIRRIGSVVTNWLLAMGRPV